MLPENSNDILIENLFNDFNSLYSNRKYNELAIILCCNHAVSLIHQENHWKSSGPTFYADHQLFQRLYEETSSDFDSIAERAIGLGGELLVNKEEILSGSYKFIKWINKFNSNKNLSSVSNEAEKLYLDIIEACMSSLKDKGLLSRGLEQMLGNIADKHETLIYLIGQRIK